MKSIIELAREAGLGTSLTHNGGEPRVWIEGADWHEELTRFAALVRAAALEEAAGVCDMTARYEEWELLGGAEGKELSNALASAIRALKEKT